MTSLKNKKNKTVLRSVSRPQTHYQVTTEELLFEVI